MQLLFLLFLTTLSISAETKKWCDVDNLGTLKWTDPVANYSKTGNAPCVYKDGYTDDYHGFLITQDTSKKLDTFEIRQTCCSLFSIWDNLENNRFTVYDTRDDISKHLFIVKTAEEYLRSHMIFTIYNNAKNNPWSIDTNNIISKSSIILDGTRSYEDAKKNPYKIEASTGYFNLTSHKENKEREVVYLSYTWGYSPFLNVSGNIDVYLTGEVNRHDCQYRFTIAKEEGYEVKLMGVDNPNLEMKVVCQHGMYQRVAVCSKLFLQTNTNYEDCGCSYEDYEYGNKAMDCQVLSDSLNFQPSPVQDTLPNEYKWGGFKTLSDTEIMIPKGLNLTIAGNVTLPQNNLVVSGNLYFEGKIIINDAYSMYDLGSFNVSDGFEIGTNLQNVKDPVFFVGECSKYIINNEKNTTTNNTILTNNTCDDMLKAAGLKEQKCGGSKNRFIRESSTLGCKCNQKSETTFEQSDCEMMSTQRLYQYELTLNGSYNGGKDKKRYWNSIKFTDDVKTKDKITYVAGETKVYGTCDFSNVKTMELIGKLTCEKLIISASTRIIGSKDGMLKTYDIEINGDIDAEINNHAIFRFGEGEFITDGSMLLKITSSQQTTNLTKCFELATSSKQFSQNMHKQQVGYVNGTNSEFKYQLYVYGNLLRICPKKDKLEENEENEEKVICNIKDSRFKVFDYQHCPCSGSHCYYYIDSANDADILLSNNLDATVYVNRSISFYSEKKKEEAMLLSNNYLSISKVSIIKDDVVVRFIGDFEVGLDSQSSKYEFEINGDVVFNGYKSDSNIFITTFGSQKTVTFKENNNLCNVMIDAKADTTVKIGNGKAFALNKPFQDNEGKIQMNGNGKCLTREFTSLDQSKCIYNISDVENKVETQIKCDVENCISCSEENKCKTCVIGYTINSEYQSDKSKPQCKGNIENCVSYSSANTCTICKNGYHWSGTECKETSADNSKTIVGNTIVECDPEYYLKDGSCIKCGDNITTCENSNTPLTCENGFVLQGNKCVSLATSNCALAISETNHCGRCKPGFYNRQNCQPCGKGCSYCLENKQCGQCNDTDAYIAPNGEDCVLFENNSSLKLAVNGPEGIAAPEFKVTTDIVKQTSLFCEKYSKGLCVRCSGNYYAINGYCKQCPLECGTCFLETIDQNYTIGQDGTDKIHCLTCKKATDVLTNDNRCVAAQTGEDSCATPMSGNLGCAICKDGYYRDDRECKKCAFPMITCSNANTALTCDSNYYLYSRYEKEGDTNKLKQTCELKSSLANCKESGENGCTECYTGFFVKGSQCVGCVDRCIDCESETKCRRCSSEYIVNKDGKCEHYRSVEYCISSDGLKCNECASGYTLKGGECDKDSLWYVYVIIAVVVLLIFVVIVIIIAYIVMKRNMKLKQDDIQKIKHMNIDLSYTHEFIVSDHDKFVFYEENQLKVNETRKFEQTIGNIGKNRIKIQPTLMSSEKYDFKVQPSLVVLGHGKCVTFKFEITPFCSTHIEETVIYNILMFKTDQESTFEVKIDADTNVTNILDYDELIPEKKIGEGSFGVVYKGKFRGNKVAIKSLKAESALDEQLEEFNKEVSMLDKFRSDYIVHFYGAVFIPNRICMVTEFAKFGSLQHLIQKEQGKKIPKEAVRIKICMDAARGMMYLHQNGILHRDIKPDNLLIFSLEKNVPVFAKLTDFGSSRNINLMMTNMTFTKGIGTPAYMAPEVLDQSRYKTAADVYSMAITMFETMKWGLAYPTDTFKYPWDIASYVSQGKRPIKPKKMRQQIYNILQRSWSQDPSERLRIEEVVEQLSRFNVNYQ